jgi:membrane metallo-endopeptidase-like protein 1
VDQLVLALPSRDYYLKASSEGDLKAYHRYMTQTAVLLGANVENAFKELDHVVKFEMKLANVSKIQFRSRHVHGWRSLMRCDE